MANNRKARICLNMIVKNESAVIGRCLASLRDHIDAWVIVDTGSTDDTVARIEQALQGIPGATHYREWRNFGHNRSEAASLAYAAGCDYLLFMDADDLLVAPAGFAWPVLERDAYDLWLIDGDTQYVRPLLVSTRLAWRWVGVVHEYPQATPPTQQTGRLEQPRVISVRGGARSQDANKYQRDAALLEQGLVDEPGNARYMFYLAQSYRDSGQLKAALAAYERRTAMAGWDEETWCASLQIARLKERMGEAHRQVLEAYLAAFEMRRTRAEPLVDLARMARCKNQFAQAYLFASHAASLPQPDDRLFVEAACYSWRARDELAIAAYWTDRFAECRSVCDGLLTSGLLPQQEIARVKANRDFAIGKLRSVR